MRDPVPQNKMNSDLGRHSCMHSCTCVHMNTHRHKSKVKQVCKNTDDSYSNNKAEYGDTLIIKRPSETIEPRREVLYDLTYVKSRKCPIVANRNKEK